METELKGEGADLDMKPNIRDLKDYLEVCTHTFSKKSFFSLL